MGNGEDKSREERPPPTTAWPPPPRGAGEGEEKIMGGTPVPRVFGVLLGYG